MSISLQPKTKLFLMFAPLAFMFGGLFVLVDDARHPVTASDQCVISATGKDVAEANKSRGHYIYRQSDSELNDVSLQCDRMGTLLLNDAHLFLHPVQSGQAVSVSHKQYKILPERWLVNVRTGLGKN